MKKEYLREIKSGLYSAVYFKKTKKIIEDNKKKDEVVLQFTCFMNGSYCLSGIKHCIEILKTLPNNKDFEVFGLKDGQIVSCIKPVLIIKGNYSKFGWIEGVIDGILSRETSIATNCHKVINIAKPKQVIFMADRSDLFVSQPFDGYAAYMGGIRTFTTDAHVQLISDKKVTVVGTMPHALIQQFNGDLSKALKAYQKSIKGDKLSTLVDYTNDVVNEINTIAKTTKNLYSIRIDTSSSVIDKSLINTKNNYGVSKQLVINARKALDKNKLNNVKIIVSSGFNYEKIKDFETNKVPVDIYGVGASLLKVDINFTGDLVCLNKKHQAKYNRKLLIDYKDINKLTKYI